MQSAQHRLREYNEALANTMSRLLSRERSSFRRRIGHAGPQRHMWARAVVVRSPISQDGHRISQSRHSRLIVPIARSQIALAFGLRNGDFRTLRPSRLIDSSRLFAKMLSRPWIR